MIYFITDGNFTKIGVSNDVTRRLKELQTSNAKELSILKTIEGEYVLESKLHDFFSVYNVHGEWYKLPKHVLNRFENNILKYKEDHNKLIKYIDDRIELNKVVKGNTPAIVDYIMKQMADRKYVSSALMASVLGITKEVVRVIVNRLGVSEHIVKHNNKVMAREAFLSNEAKYKRANKGKRGNNKTHTFKKRRNKTKVEMQKSRYEQNKVVG